MDYHNIEENKNRLNEQNAPVQPQNEEVRVEQADNRTRKIAIESEDVMSSIHADTFGDLDITGLFEKQGTKIDAGVEEIKKFHDKEMVEFKDLYVADTVKNTYMGNKLKAIYQNIKSYEGLSEHIADPFSTANYMLYKNAHKIRKIEREYRVIKMRLNLIDSIVSDKSTNAIKRNVAAEMAKSNLKRISEKDYKKLEEKIAKKEENFVKNQEEAYKKAEAEYIKNIQNEAYEKKHRNDGVWTKIGNLFSKKEYDEVILSAEDKKKIAEDADNRVKGDLEKLIKAKQSLANTTIAQGLYGDNVDEQVENVVLKQQGLENEQLELEEQLNQKQKELKRAYNEYTWNDMSSLEENEKTWYRKKMQTQSDTIFSQRRTAVQNNFTQNNSGRFKKMKRAIKRRSNRSLLADKKAYGITRESGCIIAEENIAAENAGIFNEELDAKLGAVENIDKKIEILDEVARSVQLEEDDFDASYQADTGSGYKLRDVTLKLYKLEAYRNRLRTIFDETKDESIEKKIDRANEKIYRIRITLAVFEGAHSIFTANNEEGHEYSKLTKEGKQQYKDRVNYSRIILSSVIKDYKDSIIKEKNDEVNALAGNKLLTETGYRALKNAKKSEFENNPIVVAYKKQTNKIADEIRKEGSSRKNPSRMNENERKLSTLRTLSSRQAIVPDNVFESAKALMVCNWGGVMASIQSNKALEKVKNDDVAFIKSLCGYDKDCYSAMSGLADVYNTRVKPVVERAFLSGKVLDKDFIFDNLSEVVALAQIIEVYCYLCTTSGLNDRLHDKNEKAKKLHCGMEDAILDKFRMFNQYPTYLRNLLRINGIDINTLEAIDTRDIADSEKDINEYKKFIENENRQYFNDLTKANTEANKDINPKNLKEYVPKKFRHATDMAHRRDEISFPAISAALEAKSAPIDIPYGKMSFYEERLELKKAWEVKDELMKNVDEKRAKKAEWDEVINKNNEAIAKLQTQADTIGREKEKACSKRDEVLRNRDEIVTKKKTAESVIESNVKEIIKINDAEQKEATAETYKAKTAFEENIGAYTRSINKKIMEIDDKLDKEKNSGKYAVEKNTAMQDADDALRKESLQIEQKKKERLERIEKDYKYNIANANREFSDATLTKKRSEIEKTFADANKAYEEGYESISVKVNDNTNKAKDKKIAAFKNVNSLQEQLRKETKEDKRAKLKNKIDAAMKVAEANDKEIDKKLQEKNEPLKKRLTMLRENLISAKVKKEAFEIECKRREEHLKVTLDGYEMGKQLEIDRAQKAYRNSLDEAARKHEQAADEIMKKFDSAIAKLSAKATAEVEELKELLKAVETITSSQLHNGGSIDAKTIEDKANKCRKTYQIDDEPLKEGIKFFNTYIKSSTVQNLYNNEKKRIGKLKTESDKQQANIVSYDAKIVGLENDADVLQKEIDAFDKQLKDIQAEIKLITAENESEEAVNRVTIALDAIQAYNDNVHRYNDLNKKTKEEDEKIAQRYDVSDVENFEDELLNQDEMTDYVSVEVDLSSGQSEFQKNCYSVGIVATTNATYPLSKVIKESHYEDHLADDSGFTKEMIDTPKPKKSFLKPVETSHGYLHINFSKLEDIRRTYIKNIAAGAEYDEKEKQTYRVINNFLKIYAAANNVEFDTGELICDLESKNDKDKLRKVLQARKMLPDARKDLELFCVE